MSEEQQNQNKKQKKQKKQPRLKARQPRGFVDRDAADIRAVEAMMAKIKGVYELYGFDPVETPMFEYTDALGKFLPDTDRPNAGVFSLQDEDEQWMSLRYDLTAPLARHFAQNINELQTPYRTYRAGYVFRNEKPGPGRFRQFMQFDADTVGAPNPSADAEMCMMMADTMDALGLKGQYIVRVNNRKMLDAVIGIIMAPLTATSEQKLSILRSIDKLDRFGWEGVKLLLTKGRLDESGDRTNGVGLDEERADFLCEMLRDLSGKGSFSEDQLSAAYEEFAESMQLKLDTDAEFDDEYRIQLRGFAAELQRGVEQLSTIQKLCRKAGYQNDRIAVDPTCVRGLEYYTGAVYECELTFPVTNEKGETVTFGAVAGGGRYDGLVKRFTGQDIPATGFSIGVSRLMTALKNLGKLESDTVTAPVVVCVMDRDTEALAGYQKMVQELRNAGIRAEMYQGNPKQFGKQLQYADRRGSPIAIIQGGDEREAGTVQVKDLIEGLRLSKEITDNEEWRAARPAQQTIKRDELVATVQQVLAVQEADRKAEREA